MNSIATDSDVNSYTVEFTIYSIKQFLFPHFGQTQMNRLKTL